MDSVLKQYKDLGTLVSEDDMRTFTSRLETDCGNRPNVRVASMSIHLWSDTYLLFAQYSYAINYWLDGMRKREIKEGKERRFAECV